ncbi:hypothetical protein T08_14741 [Trichinella sp. T8]|nr:hypothetical protein T08_14741 [Trichinella sp. T8]
MKFERKVEYRRSSENCPSNGQVGYKMYSNNFL